jgi:hypothetical protein
MTSCFLPRLSGCSNSDAGELSINKLAENLQNACFDHAIRKERRRVNAWTYASDNRAGYFTNLCCVASRIILIPVTQRIPAAKRRGSHSESSIENPKTMKAFGKSILPQLECQDIAPRKGSESKT